MYVCANEATMPKGNNQHDKRPEHKKRLERRAEWIKKKINELDKKGFRTNAAVKKVADILFLSESRVYKDYRK